jgi:MscS family membrane protein
MHREVRPPDPRHRPSTPMSGHAALGRVLRVAGVAAVALVVLAAAGSVHGTGVAHAQENPLEPLDASSPQATYLSFVAHVELLEDLLLAYQQDRSEENQAAFDAALSKVADLFDLSAVAEANEREAVGGSFARLADILNRIPPPDLDEIPDLDDVEEARTGSGELALPDTSVPILRADGGIETYTLPGSEITITRIDEGVRAGEYVFSADTVSRLAGWRDDIDGLPVNDGVEVRDWVQEEADFTGHLVPRSLVDAFPDEAASDVLGAPLWKLVADLVILGLAGVMTAAWHRVVGRRGAPGTLAAYLFRLTSPVVLLVVISFARRLMDEQVNHSGDVATIANLLVTCVIWFALAWGFWMVVHLVVESIIASPRISNESIDAHLLRLLAKVVSAAGALSLALVGLSRIGVPTVGLGVGAGVVGLAVGLAATSTSSVVSPSTSTSRSGSTTTSASTTSSARSRRSGPGRRGSGGWTTPR